MTAVVNAVVKNSRKTHSRKRAVTQGDNSGDVCACVAITTPCERGEMVCYLVDPASSHMLVSKIKPCMSKYMPN